MPSHRLSPNDWIAAGFRTLAQHGHTALRAEAIARALKTTKGSFYWHFADVPTYRAAMLDLWEGLATQGIIEELNALPPGKNRLTALIERTREAPEAYGGAAAEPAIRAWARFEPDVAARLERVDARRIAFIAEDFAALRLPDAQIKARLVYAAHIGTEQLQLTLGGDGRDELEELIALILSAQEPARP
ncbi:TetR/AcrR family transcriptional regulator [Roseobacteraceae bacterium S113]